MYKGPPYHKEGNIQEEAVMMIIYRDILYRDWRPPKRGRYPNQGGRQPD